MASGPGSSMQKLRADRKRGSSIQRFSSTSTRCMSAICPAGPPKLSTPILAQTRSASPKEGAAAGSSMAGVAAGLPVMASSSGRRLGGGPVVRLLGGVAAPAVEGIVERHGRLQLGEIVAVHARVAERGREQTGRLRRQIESRGIGAAHDGGEMQKRAGLQAELLQHGVEGAGRPAVAPEHAVDVEG